MRKLFALLFVAGTIAFASCQGEQKTEEAGATDSAAVETPAVAPADTAAAPADSAAAPAAADSAAAPAAH
jgi:hypothetical protein